MLELLIFSKNMTTAVLSVRYVFRLVPGEYGHGAKAIERSREEAVARWADAAKRLPRQAYGIIWTKPPGLTGDTQCVSRRMQNPGEKRHYQNCHCPVASIHHPRAALVVAWLMTGSQRLRPYM